MLNIKDTCCVAVTYPKGEKEELSQELSQVRQANTSLTSELASLTQEFERRQGENFFFF